MTSEPLEQVLEALIIGLEGACAKDAATIKRAIRAIRAEQSLCGHCGRQVTGGAWPIKPATPMAQPTRYREEQPDGTVWDIDPADMTHSSPQPAARPEQPLCGHCGRQVIGDARPIKPTGDSDHDGVFLCGEIEPQPVAQPSPAQPSPAQTVRKTVRGRLPDEIAINACAIADAAQQTLTTCNCRWDGGIQVQQCTLHEAHVAAIHGWAERAKSAEKRLADAEQTVRKPMTDLLIDLLSEVSAHFTRDDDLPNDLLPRIDAALTASQSEPYPANRK